MKISLRSVTNDIGAQSHSQLTQHHHPAVAGSLLPVIKAINKLGLTDPVTKKKVSVHVQADVTHRQPADKKELLQRKIKKSKRKRATRLLFYFQEPNSDFYKIKKNCPEKIL